MGAATWNEQTNGNPSMREKESNNKSVAILPKGKVTPLINPGNPSRRESESIGIPKSTRGNPSKGKSESHNTSKSAHGNPSKGESKSISTSNVGRFVDIRGTGSNAPASAGGHGTLPAWPCVDDVQQEDEKPDGKEAGENKPQQRADPFPFTTPRIQKSVGPMVENSLPQLLAHVRCPSRNARIKGLADPLGN
jgi:hypothetical protein